MGRRRLLQGLLHLGGLKLATRSHELLKVHPKRVLGLALIHRDLLDLVDRWLQLRPAGNECPERVALVAHLPHRLEDVAQLAGRRC